MLEFITTIVRKFEVFVLYFIERFWANFQALDQSGKTVVVVILAILFLIIWYIVVIILRLDFKHRLRKLRNVRTILYIEQCREKGKFCTFIHEILFFQKVVIIDEEVVLRVPFEVEVKKPKKAKKLKPSRKKDRVQDQTVPLLDPSEDVYVLDFIKLNRRMVSSTFFILVTLATILFSSYRDFDVIFRGLYMLQYENYDIVENLGSLLFMFAFVISILMTIFIWIYFYTRGKWQDRLNMRWVYDTFDIVSIIPAFIAILTVLNSFVISPATVTHTSMEPTYFEGDNVFIFHMVTYDYNDVVIVETNNPLAGSTTQNEYYIKRIIGLPGDVVRIQNGNVYVNDDLVEEENLKPNTNTYCETGSNPDVDEVCTFVVPESEYFLLGDNRSMSLDSRALGTFKEKDMYGVVIFKVG